MANIHTMDAGNVKTIEGVSLVIMDKDGTMIDLHNYWSGMIFYRSSAIAKRCDLDAEQECNVAISMGVDPETRRIKPEGPVGLKGRHVVMQTAVDYLESIGMHDTFNKCVDAFDEADKVSIEKLDELIKPINGLYEFVNKLKSLGCKIAVATTDNSQRAKLAMGKLAISEKIDVIVGSDMVKYSKPNPEMVNMILSEIGISPKDTVIVGDAFTDIILGNNAGLKASIAVASGVTPKSELKKLTPYTVDDISMLDASM